MKITQTKLLNGHIVAEGIFKLIEVDSILESNSYCLFKNISAGKNGYHDNYMLINDIGADQFINCKCFKPIIISETENTIEEDDSIYDSNLKTITIAQVDGLLIKYCHKVIAIRENFSPKTLQLIVDGKLKDGDKVYIGCELKDIMEEGSISGNPSHWYKFQLTRDNHVILTSPEWQEPELKYVSWNDVYQSIPEELINPGLLNTFKWLKQNYNVPIKK